MFKDFLKATETIVVLGGLFLIFVSGKFWILPTAIVYTLLNVPNAWTWIKNKIGL